MRFEYRIARTRPAQDGTATLLNDAASQGWELVSAVAYSDGPPQLILIFRRPLQQ